MNRIRWLAPAGVLVATGLVHLALLHAAEPAARKPISLLTTQDETTGELAGWKAFSEDPKVPVRDVWRLDAHGVLVCRGTPKGYLATEKSYADFTLRLKWRWPPRQPGKGGVLLRMTGPDKIWPKSLEAQLNAGEVGDFWGLDGYALSGPAERLKNVQHPQFGQLTNLKKTADLERPAGEWNDYQIVADGGTVTLTLNGRQVNRAANCAAAAGKILLTAEGTEIQFRDLELSSADP